MARMIPDHGPYDTGSKGERDLYTVFKTELPDEYTVIHSLPWLCSAVRKLDPQAKPTGEIDFLIIHPEKGLLVLEVKCGGYNVGDNLFVHLHKNFVIDPVSQTRRNVHGIARWMGSNPALRFRMGYGLIFPDSDFGEKPPNPGMYDPSSTPPQPLYIDYREMPNVTRRVIELMDYWKGALKNVSLGEARVSEIIEFLTPTIDGKPVWASRILYDNRLWLQLTDEQAKVVQRVTKHQTSLVTGWPGTGKTLIVIEAARRLAAQGLKVLVVSFNTKLTEYVRTQLTDSRSCYVTTWHGLCAQASVVLKRSEAEKREDWYREQCELDLLEAIELRLLPNYDALLVDESQALIPSWCETLAFWFQNKPRSFFCDETQVFPYERGTIPLKALSELLGVQPFPLTIILRMPKAITNILEEAVPPNLQHSTPRRLEDDTAVEIITANPCDKVSEIRHGLIASGVSPDDIVTLVTSLPSREYFEYLNKESQRIAKIATFRGLEAPIIIILGAELLSTAELFSAYSRATSQCIAIYNAAPRHWSHAEVFRDRIKNRPENQIILQQERNKQRIDNIIAGCTDKKSLGFASVNIYWAKSWSAWLIEGAGDNAVTRMWISHLIQNLPQPIYFWPKNSFSRFHRAKSDPSITESYYTQNLYFKFCTVCNALSPHTEGGANDCTLCTTAPERVPYPGADIIDELRLMDGVVSGDLPGKRIRELQPTLPLEIAAAAAFTRAQKIKHRSNVLQVPLPLGKKLYLIAFTFAQVRIATWTPGSVMQMNVLADEIYGRFNQLGIKTALEWRSIFANAMSTFFQKGYITKVEKGLYAPVEDDKAPVPKRYRFDDDEMADMVGGDSEDGELSREGWET